jgi:hypothetical protein
MVSLLTCSMASQPAVYQAIQLPRRSIVDPWMPSICVPGVCPTGSPCCQGSAGRGQTGRSHGKQAARRKRAADPLG